MRMFLCLFVLLIPFSSVAEEQQKTIKCYEQTIVTKYMKQKGFKILFNWMSVDGKLIKLVAANKAANVLLVHINDSDKACVIDEFGDGTQAPSLFFELFNYGIGNSKKSNN